VATLKSSPPQLSVNLNKIALLRNSRPGNYPDLLQYARACVQAGAQGLTVHPRPDQRHIRAADLAPLSRLASELGVELNMEGNPFSKARGGHAGQGDYPGFLALAKEHRPQQCTLVPDHPDQLTSDHGFKLPRDGERLRPVIHELQELGLRVSLFIDPEPEAVQEAAVLGSDRVELYTGPYAQAVAGGHRTQAERQYLKLSQAAQLAGELGLGVNAGHDLNLGNLGEVATLPGLLEVSIGHALTVDTLYLGLEEAMRRYRACLVPAAS